MPVSRIDRGGARRDTIGKGDFDAITASAGTAHRKGRVERACTSHRAAHERKVLARMRTVRSQCVPPVFVNSDFVVIRWVFEFEALDGARTRIEELAYQRWAGDQVAEEKFFYDPRQLVRR